jgi:hypothetical protein
LRTSRPNPGGLQRFLVAYHDKGMPYLLDPKTRGDAIRSVTDHINKEQKNPTDVAVMTRILDMTGFYDLAGVKARMTRPDFRASLEYQVKFFMDLGQIKTAPDLDNSIVTTYF